MIEIRHLCKRFGDLTVLDDVSLTIGDGEIYGIIGQSGAGKSTLLRCINGLESYQSGSITVDGLEVSALNKRELHGLQKQMGMIFQNFNLLSRLNVFDNVALPLRFSGLNPNSPENRRRILDLVELVGLSDKLKAKPRELSGGQKQRVAIARALVLNPRILLCDEATSALDPRITQGILGLLTQIRDELNITVVVVTRHRPKHPRLFHEKRRGSPADLSHGQGVGRGFLNLSRRHGGFSGAYHGQPGAECAGKRRGPRAGIPAQYRWYHRGGY